MLPGTKNAAHPQHMPSKLHDLGGKASCCTSWNFQAALHVLFLLQYLPCRCHDGIVRNDHSFEPAICISPQHIDSVEDMLQTTPKLSKTAISGATQHTDGPVGARLTGFDSMLGVKPYKKSCGKAPPSKVQSRKLRVSRGTTPRVRRSLSLIQNISKPKIAQDSPR